jgi:hypothetical protein
MRSAGRRAGLRAGLIVATIVAAVWVLPGRAADEVFERTVPLPAGGSFALQNVNGSVTITGWGRDAVEVRAVKSSPSASAQLAVSDLARVQVNVAAASDRVTVTTAYPKDEGVDVAVAYSVRVPRRVWLQQVATVNGTVRVNGVQGAGELRSVNGDVEVSDSAGPFSARTTNGDIHMELARLTAFPRGEELRDATPLRVETVNGSIVLALPAKTAASLEVRCLKGDFQSDLPVAALGAYTPREFQGRLGGGGTPVRLSTVNGAIRIRSLTEGI